MFNFDEPRYEKVVSDALALRPQIEGIKLRIIWTMISFSWII